MRDGDYASIRELLGDIIGATIVEVTQHDQEEWQATRQSYVALHLSTGATLKFPIGDAGFELELAADEPPGLEPPGDATGQS